jgi:hypothetical protein
VATARQARSTGTDGSGGTDDSDDMRRKFREALERKQGRTHATAAGAVHDGAEKSHGAAVPTKGPGFRRKTG